MAFAVSAMTWAQYGGCDATPISADWGRICAKRTHREKQPVYGVIINRRMFRATSDGENTDLFTYAKFVRLILTQPGAMAWRIFSHQVGHSLVSQYSTSKRSPRVL